MLTEKEQLAAEKIEIRSEEVKEILGQIPRWIIRWGTTVIFIIIILLIVGSGLFKYPEIQPSTIILTTKNPPAKLIAKTNGKIISLFAEDNQKVSAGDHIVLIESAANYTDIIEIEELLKDFKLNIENEKYLEFDKSYSLGEIQSYFASFLKSNKDYLEFINIGYHHKKINGIRKELNKYDIFYSRLNDQLKVLKRELELARNQFSRDSVLYRQGVFSSSDYEKSESNLLKKEYAYKDTHTELAAAKIQIEGLNQKILDLELDYANKKSEIQHILFESYDKLIAEIDIWKQRYVLITPVDGIVTFNKFWSENQNVSEGDVVLTVLPFTSGEIVGKMNLSVQGAGKVRRGQKVNIKFASYPHMEFGMVRGEVTSISLVPDKNFYTAEVKLTNGMVTNYGNRIDFQQEMPGMADIITDDMSLLRRIFNPVKSVIKRHAGD
jgi:multidrug resistance efflux pump